MGDKHRFKPLKIEKDGKRVQACQKCGALKIGEDTVVVDEDHVELSPLTSDPSLAEGRLWFRSDEDEKRWSPDGTNVEALSTATVGSPDLTSIKGFVYSAYGAPTDSWHFTANPSENVWIKQFSYHTYDSQYAYHGSYAHWTADNTPGEVPLPGGGTDLVYNDEIMSVHQIPDGTVLDLFQVVQGGAHVQGCVWDGEYLWFSTTATTPGKLYKFTKDGVQKDWLNLPNQNMGSDLAFDGRYLWGANTATDGIYQFTFGGNIYRYWTVQTISPQGITWDGEYLFVNERGASNTAHLIYKYKPDGTLVDRYPGKLTDFRSEGMGNDGVYLYSMTMLGAADTPGGLVYKVRMSDWQKCGYWRATGGVPVCPHFDGKYVWQTSEHSGHVYKVSNAGSFDLNYNVSPV